MAAATSLLANLWTWVQIALALGSIILVHEFGHYLCAKWSGMHVDEFAVGVGPTLFEWTRNGTHYRVCPILVMGYVRIRGLEGEEHPNDLPDSFYSRPHAYRLLTLVGGAGMNLITAALLFCLLYSVWGELDPKVDTTLSEVSAGEAADKAGIKPDSRIVAVNGVNTPRPEQIEKAIKGSDGQPVTLRVVEAGVSRDVTLSPRFDAERKKYLVGVVFRSDMAYETWIGRVNTGGAAAHAGLRPGDRILSINGVQVTHPTQILDALGKVPPELERGDPKHTTLPPVALTVERRGEVIAATVTPNTKKDWRLKPPAPGEVVDPQADRPVESCLVGDPGLVLARRFQRVGLIGALGKGFGDSIDMVGQVADNLKMLLHGRGLSQVGGPVVIVKSLGNAAAVGIYELLRWAANLSIMIGVFNLLPLPALDGGRIVFVLFDWFYITAFRRRELDRKVEGWVHAVGLIALLILMVLVTVRDLRR